MYDWGRELYNLGTQILAAQLHSLSPAREATAHSIPPTNVCLAPFSERCALSTELGFGYDDDDDYQQALRIYHVPGTALGILHGIIHIFILQMKKLRHR